MTEVQTQWVEEMLKPDTVLSAGISLMIIGGIIYGVARSMFGRWAVAARENLIEQAKRDRDNPKQYQLRTETASIQRMPRIGAAMAVVGAVITVAAIVMYIIK